MGIMGVRTRHVFSALLLWYFGDNWQVICESNSNQGNFASQPSVSVERDNFSGSLDAHVPSIHHTIRSAPAAVNQISPSYKARLASPGAVSTSNFRAPTSVYVAVPLVSILVGLGSIYAYCSWKKNLLNNRNMKLEKVAETRRRVSLKPGSPEATKIALKYGLYARSQKSEHDPAALITFSSEITGLATELEMVDELVLEFKSSASGEAIPEFHKLAVDNDAYSVTINPLFNSLQSGACGYVLSSVKNPLLRFTDERQTNVPLRLENSAYVATSPSPPIGSPQDETEDQEDETKYEEDDTDGQEGVTTGSEETSTAIGSPSSGSEETSTAIGSASCGSEETSTAISSPSSLGDESTSETDTSEKGNNSKPVVGEASTSRT